MQSKDTRFPIEVGRVSIDLNKGKYIRLRWTIGTERTTLSFGSYTQDRLDAAIAIARIIESDIVFGRYDYTKAKYDPNPKKLIPVANSVADTIQKELNIKEVWEFYCEINCESVAETTKTNAWKQIETMIDYASNFLDLDSTFKFVIACKERYADATLDKPLRLLRAACNTAIEAKKISHNPYTAKVLKLLDLSTGEKDYTKQCYTREQINLIINAFVADEYVNAYSHYTHSYYANFVRFRALTGCRIEEAIAIKWDNVKVSGNRRYVIFSEAYIYGELRKTKTKTIREFPVNEQLGKLIDSIPRTRSPLLFPAIKGSYIHSGNFSRRSWNQVVCGLVIDEKLDRYLPFYNLRHTVITEMVRTGVDIATVAAWSGNSEQTIIKHYLAANKTLIPPIL